MVTKRNVKLGGFLTLQMNKEEHSAFLKNKKKDYFITLDEDKKFSCYLEIEGKSTTKISTCLVYVIYLEKNNINFKVAKLTFSKKISKKELLSEKQELLRFILLKIDFIDYDLDSNSSNRPDGVFKFR